MAEDLDAVDVELIRNSFASMLAEAETNICQTASSPIIYEIRDFCTALLDPKGRFIAQGQGGVPIFLGDLDAPVRDVLARRRAKLRPGDVFLTNDARSCGQHLNNVVAIRPIFVAGDLCAIAAIRVHWLDIGGRAAGGWVSDTTDIYQEGLQLPALLAQRDGAFREELLDLVAANVRYPQEVLGDLRAQVAATAILESRYQQLSSRYGADGLRAAAHAIWRDSERLTAARIAGWTVGSGSWRATLDTNSGEELTIQTGISVSDGVVAVDFTGTSAQTRQPINSKYGAAVAARIAYMCLTVPYRPADDGTFRRLRIHAPQGTFLSCTDDVPLAQWSAPLPTAVDTVLAALKSLVPDEVPAAHHGELGGFAFYGNDPRTARPFYQIDTVTGGWGAWRGGPGRSALKSICHGDTYTTSVELEERSMPVLVESYGLRDGSGGAGLHSGGLGTERIYRFDSPAFLNLGLVRSSLAPWGAAGGADGACSSVVVERPGEPPQTVTQGTAIPLPAGAIVRIRSGGGGGYGPPPLDGVAEGARREDP